MTSGAEAATLRSVKEVREVGNDAEVNRDGYVNGRLNSSRVEALQSLRESLDGIGLDGRPSGWGTVATPRSVRWARVGGSMVTGPSFW